MIGIDRERCVNCGSCVLACPMGLFSQGEGGPEVKNSKRCLRCWHCAAACPAEAVEAEGLGELYPAWPEEPVERLVMARRSIRRFRPEAPERELLQWALDRSEYAPSSKNQHLHSWVVLRGKERCDQVAQAAIDWGAERKLFPQLVAMKRMKTNWVTCGAPAILLCQGPEDEQCALDAAIATTTVELLLAGRGVGTCWGGYLRVLANLSPELRAGMGLTEGLKVHGVLMVGWPNGTERFVHPPRREPAKVRWVEEA